MATMNRSLTILIAFCLSVPVACTQRAAPPTVPSSSATLDLLLQHMHERLELMHLVAQVKWNAQAPIFDPAREQTLLEDVVKRGKAHQLDDEVTRAFFAAQMEAAKLIQEEDFQQWRAEKHPPFQDVSDLAGLRRQIDTLNGQILTALAATSSILESAEGQRQLESRAVVLFSDVSASASEAALRPLRRR